MERSCCQTGNCPDLTVKGSRLGWTGEILGNAVVRVRKAPEREKHGGSSGELILQPGLGMAKKGAV